MSEMKSMFGSLRVYTRSDSTVKYEHKNTVYQDLFIGQELEGGGSG